MTARDFALLEIDARHLPGWPANIIHRPASHPGQSAPRHSRFAPPKDPRDLALAEQIATGVIKNLFPLLRWTEHYSGRRLKQIDPLVQKILAMSLYQLRLLTRIPASAAVDEAVEQAKRFGRSRAAGFVNAVLRNVAAKPPPPPPARSDEVEFAKSVLSHPAELFRKLEREIGTRDALRFCEHDQLEPPTIVRLFPGSSADALQSDGVEMSPHEQAGMFVVRGARRALLADWAQRGIAQVQDPTSAAVVAGARLEPGQTVLDRCCGMGTKTIQIQQAVGDGGRVFAMDPAKQRCEALRSLLSQRSIRNVTVHCAAWLKDVRDPDMPQQFERIIADVPCSNSGVLARRPEARYHQGDKALRSLVELQDRILDDTVSCIRPGGLLIYSTCSVWPEENDQRVQAFMLRHPGFKLLEQRMTWPSYGDQPAQYHDGGYVAVVRRVEGN